MALPRDTLAELYLRYTQSRQDDGEKNAIIDGLFAYIHFQLQQYASDHQSLSIAQRLKKENDALHRQIGRLQVAMHGEGYVLVLLDANELMFDDPWLGAGAQGALKAVETLVASVQHDSATAELLPSETKVKVITRVYADARRLADALHGPSTIGRPDSVDKFFQAINHNPFCDYIEASATSNTAWSSMADALDVHIHDPHCLQIYLGCLHDNGRASLLERYTTSPQFLHRLTLLQGPACHSQLSCVGFRHVTLSNLFRSTRLDLSVVDRVKNPFAVSIGTRIVPAHMPTPPLRSLTNTPAVGTAAVAASGGLNVHAAPFPVRRSSDATSISSEVQVGIKATGAPKTWAELAQDGARNAEIEAVKVAKLVAQKQHEAELAAAELKKNTVPLSQARALLEQGTIPRNVKGLRIDPPERRYDREQVQRVRRRKWCIQHFLHPNRCPFGKACVHAHEPRPSADDMEWLKLVARLQPCNNKSACADLHCCYGHRCLAPVKDGKKGGLTCVAGDDCRFDETLHGVDTNIVKTVTI